MERKTNERKREPSRLALELADAFAPCAQWSEVRVERGAEGRRTRVIVGPAGGAPSNGATGPFDWAAGTL
jgi:anti-sigma-K factor RskA